MVKVPRMIAPQTAIVWYHASHGTALMPIGSALLSAEEAPPADAVRGPQPWPTGVPGSAKTKNQTKKTRTAEAARQPRSPRLRARP